MKNTDKITITVGQLKKLIKEANEEPIKRFEEITDFPLWAVMYFYIGDKNGMSTSDIELCEEWRKENGLGDLIDVDEDTYFSRHPAFGDATMCCNVRFAVSKKRF